MKETIRQSIENGSFKILNEPYFIKNNGDLILNNGVSPRKKKLDNLNSWKSFYDDKCNTGSKKEYKDFKTQETKIGNEIISRKVPFYSWQFLNGGKIFSQNSYLEVEKQLNLKSTRLDTTKDQDDKESSYFISKELQLLLNSNQNYKRN